MTAEDTFKLYRAYKLYFAPDSKYDFTKYKGAVKTPPLIQQPDRQFYHRIAQKLKDAEVHALYMTAFFHNPRAYVSEFVNPENFTAAMIEAGRAENGIELLKNDLYKLRKSWLDYPFEQADMHEWLYGEAVPLCIGQLMDKEIPLDIACLLLLIPQPDKGYEWVKHWQSKKDQDFGLGPAQWIERLQKVDQIFHEHRPGWRMMTHKLSGGFWNSIPLEISAPKETVVETDDLY